MFLSVQQGFSTNTIEISPHVAKLYSHFGTASSYACQRCFSSAAATRHPLKIFRCFNMAQWMLWDLQREIPSVSPFQP